MWRHQIKLLTCLVLIRATVFTNHYCELLARALQALSNPYCLWTCLCVGVPVCVSVCPQLMMLNISKTKRGSCSCDSMMSCLWRHNIQSLCIRRLWDPDQLSVRNLYAHVKREEHCVKTWTHSDNKLAEKYSDRNSALFHEESSPFWKLDWLSVWTTLS